MDANLRCYVSCIQGSRQVVFAGDLGGDREEGEVVKAVAVAVAVVVKEDVSLAREMLTDDDVWLESYFFFSATSNYCWFQMLDSKTKLMYKLNILKQLIPSFHF